MGIDRKDLAGYLLASMQGSARSGGPDCTLDRGHVEDILEPMTCALTGRQLYWDPEVKRADWAPSPDRIDNTLGHVPGNVRIVAWRVNWMRGNLSDEEFIAICRAVVAHADRRPLRPRRSRATSIMGVKGIVQVRNQYGPTRYGVRIGHEYLGTFDTFEEATEVLRKSLVGRLAATS